MDTALIQMHLEEPLTSKGTSLLFAATETAKSVPLVHLVVPRTVCAKMPSRVARIFELTSAFNQVFLRLFIAQATMARRRREGHAVGYNAQRLITPGPVLKLPSTRPIMQNATIAADGG